MRVQLLITPSITEELDVNQYSANLHATVSDLMVQNYNFQPNRVSNMKFTLRTYLRPQFVRRDQNLTVQSAEPIVELLLKDFERDIVEKVTIHWTTTDISVLPFGKGIKKNMERKNEICKNLSYNSCQGVNVVKKFLEDRIKAINEEERKIKKQKTSTSTSSTTKTSAGPVVPVSFDIVVAIGDSYEVLTDESNMAIWLEKEHWFVNFSQASYSTLNEMVLRYFNFKGHEVIPFSQVHIALTNDSDQSERLRVLCEAEADRLRTTDSNFDDLINGVVNELNQWSLVLPRQYAYNEAIRRLLINPVTRIASMLLGAQTIHIEAPQCVGQAAPAHFVGKGPVDFVLASGSTGTNASTVVQSALDPDPENPEIDENDPDERQQLVDALTQALYDVVIEAKILNNPAAFNQLCGECYDHAFVSSEEQAKIANKAALASSTGLDLTVVEESINSGNGGGGAAKGPPAASSTSSTNTIERAHKCVTGILTTGQTWEVFTFTTETLDPKEKPEVRFKGTLRMRVLAYQRKSDHPAEEDVRGSGATKPMSVERKEVENIVTLLYLAGKNRLHDPSLLAPPASTKSASGQSVDPNP